jgi:hypothetical protein
VPGEQAVNATTGKKRKLALSRETFRTLTEGELKLVAGGGNCAITKRP